MNTEIQSYQLRIDIDLKIPVKIAAAEDDLTVQKWVSAIIRRELAIRGDRLKQVEQSEQAA